MKCNLPIEVISQHEVITKHWSVWAPWSECIPSKC